MSDDDKLYDKDGNAYGRNWAGHPEQKWDVWSQSPERENNTGLENQPSAYDGDTPLYRRREDSSGGSSSGDGAGIAIIGLVFLLIPLIVKGVGWVSSELGKPATTVSAQGKSPLVAGLLSFFFWGGMGHIYLGQKKKGIVFIGSFIAALLLGPLVMLVNTVGAIDAYGIASKLQNEKTVDEWEFGLGEEAKKAYITLGVVIAIGIALYICGSASTGLR